MFHVHFDVLQFYKKKKNSVQVDKFWLEMLRYDEMLFYSSLTIRWMALSGLLEIENYCFFLRPIKLSDMLWTYFDISLLSLRFLRKNIV